MQKHKKKGTGPKDIDLVLGNPPWIKVEWNEGGVLGDVEPLYVLRKFSAPKLAELQNRWGQVSYFFKKK